MRHFIAPGPIALGASRVSNASTARALIASSGLAHTVTAYIGGTIPAYRLPRSHRRQMKTCARQRAHRDRRPVGGCIGASSRTPKTRSQPRSTGRASNAILIAHTALRPANGPAIRIPCGGAAPYWTWRLRPVPRLLFFFGKRLSTMRPAQCDAGRASSRPTGSLRRAPHQHPASDRFVASATSILELVSCHRYVTPPEKRGF